MKKLNPTTQTRIDVAQEFWVAIETLKKQYIELLVRSMKAQDAESYSKILQDSMVLHNMIIRLKPCKQLLELLLRRGASRILTEICDRTTSDPMKHAAAFIVELQTAMRDERVQAEIARLNRHDVYLGATFTVVGIIVCAVWILALATVLPFGVIFPTIGYLGAALSFAAAGILFSRAANCRAALESLATVPDTFENETLSVVYDESKSLGSGLSEQSSITKSIKLPSMQYHDVKNRFFNVASSQGKTLSQQTEDLLGNVPKVCSA